MSLLAIVLLLLVGEIWQSAAITPLTEFAKSKSVVNHGDITMYSKVLEKLRKKVCLNIIAIGGSVTEGHWNHTKIPFHLRWPEQLEQLLNSRFPCHGGDDGSSGGQRHRVHNQGRGSTTPSLWVEQLVGQQEALFRDVDLVLLETAVNQAAPREQAQSDAEILMSLVTKQSRRAFTATEQQAARGWTGTAVMWVVASTRRFTPVWTGVPYTRVSDAMYAQLPVAQHHGVPIVSVIDALGPFPTPDLQAWFNSTWYRGDMVHPWIWGHSLMAELIEHYLTMAYEHSRLWQLYDIPTNYIVREPRFVDRPTLDFFLDKRPVSLAFNTMGEVYKRRVTNCTGWWAYADVPEKIGFITTQPGSSCVLALAPEEVARLSVGRAHVLLLKSYENMGVFEMTITAGDSSRASNNYGTAASCSAAAGGYDPGAPALGSAVVDCLWSERASLAEMVKMDFKLPPPATANGGSAAASCLFVNLIMRRTDNRMKNKVKVLGIQFF